MGWGREEARSPVGRWGRSSPRRWGRELRSPLGGRGQVPRPPGAGSCCSHGCPAADGPRPLCPWSRPLQGQMSPRGRGQGSGGRGRTSRGCGGYRAPGRRRGSPPKGWITSRFCNLWHTFFQSPPDSSPRLGVPQTPVPCPLPSPSPL